MTLDEFSRHRWLAVYGAMIAIQTREHVRDGYGGPNASLMRHFTEEAAAVADLEEEASEAIADDGAAGGAS